MVADSRGKPFHHSLRNRGECDDAFLLVLLHIEHCLALHIGFGFLARLVRRISRHFLVKLKCSLHLGLQTRVVVLVTIVIAVMLILAGRGWEASNITSNKKSKHLLAGRTLLLPLPRCVAVKVGF